eukprot:c8952_g1_i4.p1 GENE.c8952_g1_i4~~c8952_g1_i4.p1  ORF type:complete len:134 (-),score=31.21 c8952_g1_i4:34-435(-)
MSGCLTGISCTICCSRSLAQKTWMRRFAWIFVSQIHFETIAEFFQDKDGMIPEIASVVGKKARESDLTGRERLIKAKTYPIVRNSDMVEEDEATQEIAYELVNVLILSEEQTKPPPMLEACSTETIQFPSNQK